MLSRSSDSSIPLLERVRFLAIHASNLDEFFQLQVSAVQEAARAGMARRARTGYTPIEVLKEIRDVAGDQLRTAAEIFDTDLRPALNAEGIVLAQMSDLDARQTEWTSQLFNEQIFPAITPMAVDLAHPFPYISDLSLNLAVRVKPDDYAFARVKVPPILPRFMQLPAAALANDAAISTGTTFVALEAVIAAHLAEIFPGVEVANHSMFRVTRNAEIEIADTDTDADDLMKQLEYGLNQRRFGEPVRLEATSGLTEDSLEMLTRELDLSQDAVMVVPQLLALSDLEQLYKLDRPDLKFERHRPRTTPALETDSAETADPFAVLQKRDVLLHFPYESFTESVASFIRSAARDPDVIAIKMTMYRTSERSQLVDWLVEAATNGKQVVVVVELKARFDEQANIEWARQMERAGVHVSYGLVGLKTHCKIALAVRREGRNKNQIRRYTHVGSGNYNADTATYYEDLGLLSADEAIADDISQLFNKLTGYSRYASYDKMLVAPDTLKDGLQELIAEQASKPDGYIFMKVNALVDTAIIESLYEASAQGCEINLVVRGICCLVPQVAGLSENIHVRSVIGRFLEHGRIYKFGRDGVSDAASQFFIGSPDPMPRNLRHRVEALVQINDEECKAQLAAISEAYLKDDIERWELGSDATWNHITGVRLHDRLANREY